MVTLAQLGCGYWGPNLLRSFSAHRDCHVKVVVDLNDKRRQYVEANYPRTTTAEDPARALDDPEIDAVIVATPASTHHAFARAALEAGKHVFIEKPLAMSVAEADELIELAARKSRVLMVGDTFLYNAAVRHLKRVIQDRQIGDVYYIYTQRLNLGQVRRDVNAWWNLAPHDVSILLYLMDWQLPVAVTATGSDYIQPGIHDVVFATLTWANRMTAHVHVSWLDPAKTRKVTVVGSRKMIVYDDVADDKITVFDKGIDRVPRIGERMDYDVANDYQLLHRTGDIVLPRIEMEEPLKVETAHFLHCVRTGERPLTGPDHARAAVAVLEAGHKSLIELGQVVALPAEASVSR